MSPPNFPHPPPPPPLPPQPIINEQSLSALNLGLSSLGSSPGWTCCVVFLGKTHYSHSASLHPGVQMGTGEFNAGGSHVID